MPLTCTRDGFVVTVSGAAGATGAALRDTLNGLTGGYGTRAIILPLGDEDGGRFDAAWLPRFAIPVVAALEGTVFGAATELALAADIRVASEGATIVLPAEASERRRTVCGDAAGTLTAREAFARGIVTALVAEGGAGAEAARVASVIAGRGPIATRLAKEAVWRGLPQALEQALRFETDLTLLLQTTKDRAEGVRAFIEKRAPAFTGE